MTPATFQAAKLAFNLALKQGLGGDPSDDSLRLVPILWPALTEIEKDMQPKVPEPEVPTNLPPPLCR